MKKYWFKAKGYGWGWYPSAWQGWVVMLVWIIAFTAVFVGVHSLALADDVLLKYFIPRVVMLTGLLFWVCWKTGERPRWLWAGKPVSPVFVLSWVVALLVGFTALAFALRAIFTHI